MAAVKAWTPIPGGIWAALRETIAPYVGCAFTIPGDPVPKGRPRLGKGRTFTPGRTKAAEKKVKDAFKAAMPGWEPEPDRTYGALIDFRTTSGSTVDIDNATKLIMDALNKLFYLDDIQMGDEFLHLVRGADNPGVEVWLFAVTPNGTKPTRLCECGTRYRSNEKMCEECRRKRAIINQLLAGDDAAADFAEQLDQHRRQVFTYITLSMTGTNTAPTTAAIAANVGVTPHRAGAVITTLISDGYLAREGRRLKVIKPLGAPTR